MKRLILAALLAASTITSADSHSLVGPERADRVELYMTVAFWCGENVARFSSRNPDVARLVYQYLMGNISERDLLEIAQMYPEGQRLLKDINTIILLCPTSGRSS